MSGYDLENRSSGLRPIGPSPVHGDSHRDGNQRSLLVERALQAAFDRNGNSLAQRFEALSPLRFNAAMERMSWEH
jgi:hypothetical protein